MGLFNTKHKVKPDIVKEYYCENCSTLIEGKVYSLELFEKNCGSFYPYHYLCSTCFEDLNTKNIVTLDF